MIANEQTAIELMKLVENELNVLSDNSTLGFDLTDDDDNISEELQSYINFVENAASEIQTLLYDFLGSYLIQKG